MCATRIEHDSIGELEVPADALYGVQTQRAVLNFPVSGQRMPAEFIHALVLIKCAAARANVELSQLPADIGNAIAAAATALLDEDFMQHFPVDVYQTGSGTSTNMNANEVLASLARRRLGGKSGVSANDHVNCGQSSNDVIPTAMHVSAAIVLERQLLPALDHLHATLREKAHRDGHHLKTGRTHLMDALPVRFSQVLGGWAAQVDAQCQRLRALQSPLQSVAQGGTAVGTGVNAHPRFATCFCSHLSDLIGMTIVPAPDYFAAIGAQDTIVAVSAALKGVAVALMKIANDLRWMNSGPLAGLGEIELPALQPGSSIMPGKVNPVIAESATMVAARVIGNDATVTLAGQSGNFELNVMLPLMASTVLESMMLLANAARLLADRAIAGFKINTTNLQRALVRNPMLVTALTPRIGYERAAQIAKQAYAEDRSIIDVAVELTDIPRAELERLLDPGRLTGIDS